jgi:hypothetical protein
MSATRVRLILASLIVSRGVSTQKFSELVALGKWPHDQESVYIESDNPQAPEDDFNAPDIEPDVVRRLARAAKEIKEAAHLTRWGYVSDHCSNALLEIKKAIIAACGQIQ